MSELFNNVNGDVVVMKLPNGKVQVVRSRVDGILGIYDSVEDVYSHIKKVNESGSGSDVKVLDSINE